MDKLVQTKGCFINISNIQTIKGNIITMQNFEILLNDEDIQKIKDAFKQNNKGVFMKSQDRKKKNSLIYKIKGIIKNGISKKTK